MRGTYVMRPCPVLSKQKHLYLEWIMEYGIFPEILSASSYL